MTLKYLVLLRHIPSPPLDKFVLSGTQSLFVSSLRERLRVTFGVGM
jgi:hypothetical protein